MLFEAQLAAADRAFLAEVRAFLDEHLGADIVDADDGQRSMVADFDQSAAWIDRLRPRLWHVGAWPREAGGAGLTPVQNYLLLYEMGLSGAPHLPPMGFNYVGPTLMRFGTEAQKAAFLPRIVDGTDYWCQGFSEPGAGSDLAGLATFAERRGDAYYVSGSKIWTTDAHNANRIFCLVRTRREQTRDALSFLLMDMDAPGISVRPIRLMTGDHDVNQVFLDEVEVPVENVLGGEGEGWTVAKYLLDIERGAFVFGGRLRRRLDGVAERARGHGLDDARFRHDWQRLDTDLLAFETTELRLGHGNPDTSNAMAEASVIKIEFTELMQRIDELALSIARDDALYAGSDAFGTSTRREGTAMPGWLASYFNNRAATIYGGSNEIQRNLVFRALARRRGRSI